VREERCLEPIAQCLIRTLVVPKIYFQRTWPPLLGFERGEPRHQIDILAIDRAGTGDVHAVEVKLKLREALTTGVKALRQEQATSQALRGLGRQLGGGAKTVRQVPAHYLWVAYQGDGLNPEDDEAELMLLSETPLLPPSGMGRIGVIEVVRMADLNLGAKIRLRAERFQTPNLDRYVASFVRSEKADIEFKG
jgi:hypothetical protein